MNKLSLRRFSWTRGKYSGLEGGGKARTGDMGNWIKLEGLTGRV